MEHESFIWSWLTYGWLIKNLDIIIIILLLGVTILFAFPILDTTVATFRRIYYKRPLYLSDGSNITFLPF